MINKKEPVVIQPRYSQKELEDFKIVWNQLDSELQVCARQSFEFGNRNDNLLLNELGMSQLVQHLNKYGFEIKKKENS